MGLQTLDKHLRAQLPYRERPTKVNLLQDEHRQMYFIFLPVNMKNVLRTVSFPRNIFAETAWIFVVAPCQVLLLFGKFFGKKP